MDARPHCDSIRVVRRNADLRQHDFARRYKEVTLRHRIQQLSIAVEGRQLADALNARAIPGVRFYPVRFTPASSKYAKEACQGVFIIITDRTALRPVRVGGSQSAGASAVMIEFHNAGPAISAEQIEKLFLPFFTTKKEGTGLGLPITKQIIDSHEGAIRVESDAAAGTLFRVLLPAVTESLDPVGVQS